ncbi:MAG TPA: geranylgeranylglyceryl/heptaprenylglyceryl phosphate synthase [Bacteroidia bacterium]|nr:geranylgeranylglyceryl/heptaprenylglyceryl phosphate synthase [Bacteroidia bacterium]
MNDLYNELIRKSETGKKSLAVLIDPDHQDHLGELVKHAAIHPPDYFFVGGSVLNGGNLEKCIAAIRGKSKIPILLFPGNEMQITASADGLLLLTLISGRNADLLIGRHVAAAAMIRASRVEIIPTGYLLVESGSATSVSYISNTLPVPRNKSGLATLTAMAGEQLGLKMIYLEAGSGAQLPVPLEMITEVKNNISIPLVVGGGLRSAEEIEARCRAGADMIVVGNILEQNPGLLGSFVEKVRAF